MVSIAKALNLSLDDLLISNPSLPQKQSVEIKDFTKGFKFIDLFAGIGGIRIGLESAGGECVFSSEWDEKAQDTYEANFGERPYGDITKIDAESIPDHDLLAAGFPCQSFSIIGKQKGFEETRGTLFFDIERILKDKKPYIVLLENVKNLVSHDKGRTFKVIISKLEELGYHTHWKVLNGLDFGVPQKRERTVIVGMLNNHPFAFPDGRNMPKLTAEDILLDDSEVEEKYFLNEELKERYQKKVSHKEVPEYRTIWHENKSGNIGIHDYSCALRASASYNYLTVNGYRRLTDREMLRLQGFPDSFKIPVSYTQLRKQAGNSVVVPKFIEVAKSIVKSTTLPLEEANTQSLSNSFNQLKLHI